MDCRCEAQPLNEDSAAKAEALDVQAHLNSYSPYVEGPTFAKQTRKVEYGGFKFQDITHTHITTYTGSLTSKTSRRSLRCFRGWLLTVGFSVAWRSTLLHALR